MGLKGLSVVSVPHVSGGRVLLTGVIQTRQSGRDEGEIQRVEKRSRDSENEALCVRSADV